MPLALRYHFCKILTYRSLPGGNGRRRHLLIVLGCLVAIVSAGCGKEANQGSVQLPPRPLRSMKSSIRLGDWQEAAKYSDAVLEKHSDEPETIALVAQVAHANGDIEDAARLLVLACKAESFKDPARIQQAMIALVGVGQLYDGIEMLEQAVEASPSDIESRRWLYDFYMGTENRLRGLPHGKVLVRERRFDLELLKSLSNTERRTQDARPLDEMTTRNPDDKRPLVGDAKVKFDEGDYGDAIERLNSIVSQHPDFIPAQTLLGRALAADGKLDELAAWAENQQQPIAESPECWLALGDWSRAQDQSVEATRAYWEATQADPDVLEAWSKLSRSLKSLPEDVAQISPQTLQAVEDRASRLSQFSQLKSRFERSGSISRATVAEMVTVLVDLGRLWEAEAWASIAYTLPEDDSVPLDELRQKIVSRLQEDLPWQMTANHAEFELDLSTLATPRVGKLSRSLRGPISSGRTLDTTEPLRLTNQAVQRSLQFSGHTSAKLDQPGIMLHETLGCGGGAIDFDLDGWSDLYLIAAGGRPPAQDSQANALMRNLDGQFTEATIASRTGDQGFGQGVAVGDVNEDGFPDLLILNYGPNTLLINNGDGTFANHSDRLPDNGDVWSTSAAIADLDSDGLCDIVITNYCAGLEPSTTTCPVKDSDIARSCSPMMFKAQNDQFLGCLADGSYMDVTAVWRAKPGVVGRGLGIVVGQFDDDVGLDVFVANDMTNNHYWSRTPTASPKFALGESAMVRGLGADDRAIAQGSMGIASGDLDRDGDIDLYVTNFDKEYNTYHEQQGGGVWRDETLRKGLLAPTTPLVGFGSEAVDLNNDGNLELVVANGHVDMFSREDERSVYAQPLQVFRREASGRYESVGQQMLGEYMETPHVGRALWTLDVNRDGRTDIAVTHQTEPVALLVNQSENVGDWIGLQLVAREGSRDAIGAQVVVTSGDQSWTAQKIAGDGYLCSNDSRLHVGLGRLSDGGRVELQVTWPDGSSQDLGPLACNQDWMLVQGEEPFSL
ncbi:MAG: FG-GAP-like repeat-containing protein [Rubripirellula sp.]